MPASGAGLVAALNPCGFALLPAYLTLVVRTERAGVLTAVGRALAATVAMTLGFLAAFGAFGFPMVRDAFRGAMLAAGYDAAAARWAHGGRAPFRE